MHPVWEMQKVLSCRCDYLRIQGEKASGREGIKNISVSKIFGNGDVFMEKMTFYMNSYWSFLSI